MIVVYILLFLLCLSTLIAVHELGHLMTAKIFKVYCFEYALGFGPKLFSRKRKNGETYFSIRAIPFGGFVSMYGESETVPEGLSVDPSRSLLAIRKWKRAIIMAAGVTMNFVLALVIFFVYNVAFPYYEPHYGHITISENSLAAKAGLINDAEVYAEILTYNKTNYVFYDDEGEIEYNDETIGVYFGFNYSTLTYKDTTLVNHAVAYEKLTFGEISDYSYPEVSIKDINDDKTEPGIDYIIKAYYHSSGYSNDGDNYYFRMSVSDSPFEAESELEEISTTEIVGLKFNKTDFEKFYSSFSLCPHGQLIEMKAQVNEYKDTEGEYLLIEPSEYKFTYPNVKGNNLLNHKRNTYEPKNISFDMYQRDNKTTIIKGDAVTFSKLDLKLKDSTYSLPSNLGISMQLLAKRNSFGESVKNTFSDFAYSGAAIFRGLGQLFTTSDGWQNMGGIIAIGVVTTQTLQQNGFGEFLFWWGLISVNLGIVNLLPFPGLDGWHLLVLAVEGIFRKEIPAKVKNVVSAVGVILLLALMVLIVIKDIITYV